MYEDVTYNPQLFAAIENGDKRRVESLLARSAVGWGADVNARRYVEEEDKNLEWLVPPRNKSDSFTALMIAIMKNRRDIVALLLARGADPNAEGLRLTALKLAAGHGNVPLVHALLGAGADVNQRSGGTTALMAVAKPAAMTGVTKDEADAVEVAKILLNAGADCNIQDYSGQTALMLAAQAGQARIARLLLQRGARADIKDRDQYTALKYAMEADAPDIVQLLKGQSAKLQFQEKVALYGLDSVMRLPPAQIDLSAQYEGRTLLIDAIRQGRHDIVRHLIKLGADVNLKDEVGCTPLMWAARENNISILKLLLDKGARIHEHDGGIKYTALIYAAHEGHADAAFVLLRRGARVNDGDWGQQTALMRAAQMGHTDVVRQLVAAGAQVNARDDVGHTALYIARDDENQEVVRLLQKAGMQ